jgi:Fe(3+) dicitrate transport protein
MPIPDILCPHCPLRRACLLAACVFVPCAARAQADSVNRLPTTVIKGAPPTPPRLGGVSRLPDDTAGHLYTGATVTLLRLDSLPANLANSNPREVYGRVPGLNISETRGGGFSSDGIGLRGLNPNQSIDLNVRQNGVNIEGDLYGYPEIYYTPPFESIDHIEVVRGASALEYGPQFGGMLNYVIKDGTPHTAPTIAISQTGASFGEYDAFASIAGGTGKFTYYGFGHYQGAAGWRQNSNYEEGGGYASLTYHATDNLSTTLQYTNFRDRIHMPGGLDDSEFTANPQRSDRARNWLASPWNILENITTWHISPAATWTTQVSGMKSQRYLVWRREDGGPQAPDTGYREVEREAFMNLVVESRVGVGHSLFGVPATLATGIRLFDGIMKREEDALGTTGSDFNMETVTPYATVLHFGTRDVAAYLQEGLHLTRQLTVTPGVRWEWLESTIHGFRGDNGNIPLDARTQRFALAGLGVEYALTPAVTAYGNVTQAYRPITYDNLIPFASGSRIDPHLRHSSGYTSDAGVRGIVGRLYADVDAFYIWYHDKIGQTAINATDFETTNIGDARHYGIESYVELDLLKAGKFNLSLFNTFSWISAHYVSGPDRGNAVEYAPPIIERLGPTLSYGPVSTTFTWNYTARSFGDASNATLDPQDAAVGLIPAYRVYDWSARVALGPRVLVKGGVDNITNAHYFTDRAIEYPGPGIIPADARTAYAGVTLTLP